MPAGLVVSDVAAVAEGSGAGSSGRGLAAEKLLHFERPSQFQAVMAAPPVGKTPHFALHVLPLPVSGGAASLFLTGSQWLGLVVPKRWAKRAVTRNAIRRQVRELARLQLASPQGWPGAAVVVRLRSGFSREQFVSATSDRLKAAVRAEVLQLFARALFRVPRPRADVPLVAPLAETLSGGVDRA